MSATPVVDRARSSIRRARLAPEHRRNIHLVESVGDRRAAALRKVFSPGYEQRPIPPLAPRDEIQPGKAFNPYGAFQNGYFRLRESIEQNSTFNAGAKLSYAVLEYWFRYGTNKGRISPTRLGGEIGVSRVQAHRYINELELDGVLRIEADKRFFLLKRRRRFNPRDHREEGSIIPRAIARFAPLEMIDRLMYGRLMRACGCNGKTWISQRKLADALGIDKRRAMESIRRLEHTKLIIVLRPGAWEGWKGVQNNNQAGARGGQNLYAFLGHKILVGQRKARRSKPGDDFGMWDTEYEFEDEDELHADEAEPDEFDDDEFDDSEEEALSEDDEGDDGGRLR